MTRYFVWPALPIVLFVACRLISRAQDRKRSWWARIEELRRAA